MASFWPTVKPEVLVTGTLVAPAGTVMIGPSGSGCHSGVLWLGGLMIVASRPLPDESSAVGPESSSNLYDATFPAPKSNTRDQALFCDGKTHAEIVKSCSPLTMPSGSWTYSPFPDSLTALPILPGTRDPVAPLLVTAAIVRVSAAEPVPICTCWL